MPPAPAPGTAGNSAVGGDTVSLDALIFGGGAAGLWTLDHLTDQGYRCLLLEAQALGGGQTVASQGIIHGGLKYTLLGSLTSSAETIRQMPALWRDCMAGSRKPDLSATKLRAEFCHLWRTDSLASRAGMVGARVGLAVAPQKLAKEEWPVVLAHCPGVVYRLDEQVIQPDSFIRALADRHGDRLLRYAVKDLAFDRDSQGQIKAVRLDLPHVTLLPRAVVLAAGGGNAFLLEKLGLDRPAMQRRPLHMVMARGPLPRLNGHCVDGSKTRLTITTDADSAGRTIWQVGGQISEEGVAMDALPLVTHAADEVRDVLPGIDLAGVEWSTYRVDRAEQAEPHGKRPDDIGVTRVGNIIAAWPTKLALAPRLAGAVARELATIAPSPAGQPPFVPPRDWPRPQVALPPWEESREWFKDL